MADIANTMPESSDTKEKGINHLHHADSNIRGEVIDSEVGVDMARLAGSKKTQRHLRPRHIQLMALSGAIGTGLFVGSGAALARAGPLGLLLGYSVYALLVWSTFNAMGEMVVWLPIDGSFVVFAHAFLDDAWGFALGWLYTATNSLSAAGEVAAVAAIVNFWTDSINNGKSSFRLETWETNSFSFVCGYHHHIAACSECFRRPDLWRRRILLFLVHLFSLKAFSHHLGHFLGFWSVFIQAAFAFGGPDYIAMSAGETRAPRRVLPSVFRRVIYRLAVFYILGVFAVGILVPHDDPNLGANKPGAGASPFVIGTTRLGIPVLPHVINGALLTSTWSCALELYFAATRALYALAVDGKTPRFFLFTWRGVPTFCVVAVWLVTLIAFMSASNNSLTVFTWITSIVGSANLLIYCVFHITYIRFRRAQMAQGITDSHRPWFRRHQYYYSIVSLFFYIIIFFTNGFVVFTKGNWKISAFLFAYFPFALFVITFLGYKVIKRPRMVPLHEVPLHAGRTEVDMDDGYVEAEPTTKFQKFNRWLWG
ncbi:AAT family amino acid transporter [Fusarium albosuccineum]|uniref:AAT family amino acid transporter n=1 Tax=Fusarium albosuccineum TaxID=1237068 RepID=A0A8H4P7S3_9HYPO|nr:AAT family amino acid transporter [Fusarium albosuccineum]